MDHLQYSVIATNGREIRSRWTGTCIELATFGAMWSDCQVEWFYSVETAAQRFQTLVAMNTKPPRTPRRIDFVAPYEDTPTEPDTMVATLENLSPEAEATVFPSTLTKQEARAIVKASWWRKVPDSLITLAMGVLGATNPVVAYMPIDWYEDDGSEAEEETERERGENLLRAVERDASFRNGVE